MSYRPSWPVCNGFGNIRRPMPVSGGVIADGNQRYEIGYSCREFSWEFLRESSSSFFVVIIFFGREFWLD